MKNRRYEFLLISFFIIFSFLLSLFLYKAILKVESLTKEPSFGEVSETDTFNLNGVKLLLIFL